MVNPTTVKSVLVWSAIVLAVLSGVLFGVYFYKRKKTHQISRAMMVAAMISLGLALVTALMRIIYQSHQEVIDKYWGPFLMEAIGIAIIAAYFLTKEEKGTSGEEGDEQKMVIKVGIGFIVLGLVWFLLRYLWSKIKDVWKKMTGWL